MASLHWAAAAVNRFGRRLCFSGSLRKADAAVDLPWYAPVLNGIQPNVGLGLRGFANHRHKRLLKHAKGYRGRSKNCFVIAIRRVEKAWQYAYRDRKVKKRTWRTLWIQRLSAAARQYQMRYSQLIAGLNHSTVPLNRKVLSELAATEPFAFKSVIDVIRYQQAEHDAKKALQQR